MAHLGLGLDFNALRDMHDSANDLLHSPLIQKFQEKWVHHVSEASVSMLDVCHISNDLLLLARDQVQDLQLTLRMRRSSTSTEDADYSRFRKKLEKETLRCLQSLKRMKLSISKDDVDRNLVAVALVDVLTELRATSISIVESLLSLVSIPWLDRTTTTTRSGKGRGLKLKLWRSSNCQPNKIYCGVDDIGHELALQSAHKRLEAVEITIQDLEAEIRCICRRLIHTRFLLLNILTS